MYKIIGANRVEYGPVSADQIRQWIVEGRVNAETSAQAVGDTAWKPIGSFAEFAASFPSASAPPSLSTPPPTLGTTAPSEAGRAAALADVNGPGIGLIVAGSLAVVYSLFSIIANLTGMTFNGMNQMNFPGQNPEFVKSLQAFQGGAGIMMAVVQLAIGLFIIYGGIKMRRLENYGFCMAASIIAVIPCCICCCIGIPIGIWSLIVLNKPEVRNYFT